MHTYIHFHNNSLWFSAPSLKTAIAELRDSQYLGKFTISKLINREFFIDYNASEHDIELSHNYHLGKSNHLPKRKLYRLCDLTTLEVCNP